MQNGKNHFQAKMTYDDDTIRLMFRAEYYTYAQTQILAWYAIAAILVGLAVMTDAPAAVKAACLMVGGCMAVSPDFPSKMQAERVLEQRHGAVTTVTCSVNEAGVDTVGNCHYNYDEIDYLVADEKYCYIFIDRQTAVMLDKATLLPHNPERFQAFVARQTKKTWKKAPSLAMLNLGTSCEILADKLTGRTKRLKRR